eukprot:2089060-Amphidinium_carterae.1
MPARKQLFAIFHGSADFVSADILGRSQHRGSHCSIADQDPQLTSTHPQSAFPTESGSRSSGFLGQYWKPCLDSQHIKPSLPKVMAYDAVTIPLQVFDLQMEDCGLARMSYCRGSLLEPGPAISQALTKN